MDPMIGIDALQNPNMQLILKALGSAGSTPGMIAPQGQPEPVAPPAAPGGDMGGFQGALWKALGVQTPSWIQGLNEGLKSYASGGAAPTAAPPKPQIPTMAQPAAPAGVPRVASTAPVPGTGGGQSFDLGTMPQVPTSPTFTAPAVGGIKPYDFTEYKKLLAKTDVTGTENMANVLGGLSKGAASVSATEPGSFAKTLASMGAGGMEGLAKSTQAQRENAMRHASAELTMQSLQHAASKDSAELAYKGAELAFKADIQTKLLQHEQQMKKFELQMPKVSHDANGVTVQQVDPATNKMTATYHPTKTFLDHAEKMKDVITALSGNGPVAEATEAKYLMDSYKGNPQLGQAALTQLAVRRTIENGAGQTVFGSAYELAAKAAAKQLTLENPTLQTHPDLFQRALEHRITSTLLGDPRVSQLGWVHTAAPHSVAARLLSEGLGGGQPTQPAAAGQ